MKTYLPLLSLGALALAGAAHATQTPPAPPPHGGGGMAFERMDANGDGKVTRAEYDAVAAERFQRLDANGDGTIDAAEMPAGRGPGRRMRPDG